MVLAVEFYIRITDPHGVGDYYFAHKGLETCGLSPEEVVRRVADILNVHAVVDDRTRLWKEATELERKAVALRNQAQGITAELDDLRRRNSNG